MTRSPLAYPLNRSADMDGGGAADLQTDIMRFMAILSLCLVAIFALVQSIPMTPAQPIDTVKDTHPQSEAVPEKPAPIIAEVQPLVAPKPPAPKPVQRPVEKTVALTRPRWVPKYQPKPGVETPLEPVPEAKVAAPSLPELPPAVDIEPEKEGFTLRFESDAALMRLVAASHVGLYAIESDRAQRMTVSESRISFWDASTPNTFHEMETNTVPNTVIEALSRSGTRADGASWGVTLPGKLKTQLDNLMQEHRGGSLIIAASGDIRWEAS